MSSLLPFGFIMPTDGPCPPADWLSEVDAQYIEPWNFPYAMADELTMSRFQWLGYAFDASLKGTLKIRGNGATDWALTDKTIPFEVAAASGIMNLVAAGPATVVGRMPSSPVPAGLWIQFAATQGTGSTSLAGSHSAFSDSAHLGYTAGNYRVYWRIEIGQFLAPLDPKFPFADPAVPEAHIYQIGDSYRIPFRAGVRFSMDITKDDPELPDPPSFGLDGLATTCPERFLDSTPQYVAGAINVRNAADGSVVLFPGPPGPDGEVVGGFGMNFWGYEASRTGPNGIYFEDLYLDIRASQLAALP